MAAFRFAQVDAFSARPFFGNPVAVVLGADGLTSDEMQRIAAWTNLSETTFVLPPRSPAPPIACASSRRPRAAVRGPSDDRLVPRGRRAGIVSPRTAGSCSSAARATCRCGSPARDRIAGSTSRRPSAKLVGELPEAAAAISAALGRTVAGTPPTAFRNGPIWLFVRCESEADVTSLAPDMSALAALSLEYGVGGVAAFAFVDSGEFAVHLRCFAPASGVPEDPVTGSANAALPAYLAHHGLLDRVGRDYLATQGTELGRDGRVRVRVLDGRGRAEIGGQAVTVIEGELRIG
jgi:predicted PhzF superfamily epimerase YddE/YHI9